MGPSRNVWGYLKILSDFYQIRDIKSDTIVEAIIDILLRLQLDFKNLRGQTYDGASNMLGKKSGVAA